MAPSRKPLKGRTRTGTDEYSSNRRNTLRHAKKTLEDKPSSQTPNIYSGTTTRSRSLRGFQNSNRPQPGPLTEPDPSPNPSPNPNPTPTPNPNPDSNPKPTLTGPTYAPRPAKVAAPPKRRRAWRQRDYVLDDDSVDSDEVLLNKRRTRQVFKLQDDEVREREVLPHEWRPMDSSDEDDDHDEDDDNHGRAVLQPPSSPDTVFSSTPPKHRRKAARRSESAVVKLSALLHQQQDEVGPPSEGTEPSPVIPDWMDLRIEHSIWVQIFEYAAVHPGQNLIRTQWLLQTALVCRAFLDPALTVLYRCPPLTSDTRLQRLNLLLSTCPSQTRLNYRAKIRSLHIDVTKTHLREGLADPGLLIRNLTNLSEVRLVHPYDEPPYRNLTDHIRFDYPAPLFHALDVAREDDKRRPTRLKSWQWNARMMKQGFVRSLAAVRELHLTPAFAELRTIHFVNYQLPSWERHRKPPAADDSAQIAADEMYARELAGCLAVLGHLEDLTFESSSVVGPPLLDLLPSRLKRVQFTNCWLLDSQDLAAYLTSHGQNLESLTLNHNHSLDLAFLPLLGPTCPNLKELRMNMRYFREHDSWGDAAPNYEHLLLPDQVPKWPPSLQLVDLDSLRRWTPHVAEMFFQSFIDSAPALPMLRHLSLKCMLNIPWRQRSAMRQEWQERLEAIFLRPYEPPEEHYTLRAALAPPPAFGQVAKPKTKKAAATRPSRQSVRIATLQGDSPSRAGAAGKNLRSLGRTLYEEPDSDEFDVEMAEEQDADGGGGGGESEADGSGTGEEPRRSFFVQGLCNVVSLKLDNQKPREQQWQMADFVDSTDDASDPEWPGTEDDEE